MDTQQEKELEIDLIELFREIKRQWPLIIIVTLLFTVVAYVYKFVYLPPVYTYTRMVKCPARTAFGWTIPDQELLSYVAIFRTDMGNKGLWKDGTKGRLTGADLVREKNISTKLIQFQFSGTDPEYIKTASQQYMESVAQRLNNFFAEVTENEFRHRYYRTATDELSFNNALLGTSNATPGGNANYQALLKERLEALEKDKTFLEAKIIDNANIEPAKINNRPFVNKCAASGLFLSLAWIIGRYIWRQAAKNEII